MEAFNRLFEDKERLIEDYTSIIQVLTDTSALDKEASAQQSECDVTIELIRKCVDENSRTALDQQDYQERYNELADRYEAAKKRLGEISSEKRARIAKRENISRFISGLEQCGGLLESFDEALWYETVESVKVNNGNAMTVFFKNGGAMM